MNEFVDRLRMAFDRSGITQRGLATQVGVGQPTVSQWLRGLRQPESAAVSELAKALAVDPAWLLFGQGEGPQANLEQLRVQYREEVGWRPAPENPDGSREYGRASTFTLRWELKTLVREVLQNSLDVVLPGRTGKVRLSLIRLSGSDLRHFLSALDFDTLRPHLDASADGEQQMSTVLRRGLAAVDAGELWLLRITDCNTYGLTGPDFDRGRFTGLTRNTLDSEKAESRRAGGSYGIGKAVLWSASNLATVLFCSDPVDPDEGGQRLRIIGKSELAWHELEDSHKRFAGPAWFGRADGNPDSPRAWSVWDNPALAADLLLDRREEDGSGTSIIIVGFDPPGEEGLRLREVAGKLEDAAATHFWPAVGMNRLQVTVDVEDNGQRVHEAEISSVTLDAARRELLGRHETETYDEALIEVGDVVRISVPLEVPARIDGSPEERHKAFTHHVDVLVRRSQPEDGPDWVGHAEFFRGAGMVVKSRPLERLVVGAHPFHVAVFAGLAANDNDEVQRAEDFLKAAEPVEHDEWTYTSKVKSQYARGGGAALQHFFTAVNTAVREVLQPTPEDVPDGPRDLAEMFRLTTPRGSDTAPTLVIDDQELDPVTGAWRFDCTVRVPKPDHRAVRLVPVLRFDGETGGGTPIGWAELEAVANCTLDDGHVRIEPGRRTARFRAQSDPDTYPAQPQATRVTVDLRAERILP